MRTGTPPLSGQSAARARRSSSPERLILGITFIYHRLVSSQPAPHAHALVILDHLVLVVILDLLAVLIIAVMLVLAVLYVSNSVCMSVCGDVCVHIIFLA
jgi:hypothetical protein